MEDKAPKKEISSYKPSKKQKERIKALQDRFNEIEMAEKNKGLRANLEKWNKIYVPHDFNKPGLRKWQSKNAKNVAFTKIQTALAVIIEQLPGFQFFPRTNQDKPLIPLWKSLMEYIGDVGRSLVQLKKFFFNLFKDGTAIGQVYWKLDTRKVKFEKEKDEKGKITYREEVIEDFNNPHWCVLERKDVYLDEKARSWNPLDEHPVRDWFKRVVYDKDGFKTRFPEEKYLNAVFCKNAGELTNQELDKTLLAIGKDQYEVLFYENKPKDRFSILCHGVLLRDRPLPYNHKQLSIFGSKLFEKPDDIDGIGFCEALENDESMLDNLSNATVDEINLAVRRALIVGYGEELEDEDLELAPNKILRLRDPASAKWLEKTGVGPEPFKQEEVIKADMAEKVGVSKELLGGMAQRKQTATETAINREAGLRRLKTPLDNVEEAMETKERLMISLTKQVYKIPTKKEIQEGGIESLQFREIRLPITITEKDEFILANEENIIEMKPAFLANEPDIKIKHMSMMPVSKAMVKQDKMQFYSLIGQHPYTDTYKAYRQICEAWEEDPEDWMKSDETIIGQQQMATQAGAELGQMGQEGGGGGNAPNTMTTVPTEAGTAQVPQGQGQQGIFKRALQKLTGRMT